MLDNYISFRQTIQDQRTIQKKLKYNFHIVMSLISRDGAIIL